MRSEFDSFISTLLFEAEGDQVPPEGEEGAQTPPEGEEVPPEGEMAPPPEGVEAVSPEEMELARLAVRAIYFNVGSKNLHNLKLKWKGQIIPFEKIPDYFEKTKNILPTLGFIEWAMDKYEGVSTKWSEDPDFKGLSIVQKIKKFNKELPDEQRMDNDRRVYWTRIILNCLLRGSANYNLNASDINEKNMKEVFRLLKQDFGRDTRGLFDSDIDMSAPGTF